MKALRSERRMIGGFMAKGNYECICNGVTRREEESKEVDVRLLPTSCRTKILERLSRDTAKSR
jgi:hypothetical protein